MLWIAGGQLADPTPRPGALCVDGETIGAKAQAAPPGASAIDARGLILVPALIDAHVHLCVAGDPATVSREQARRGLAAVLDLGAPERMLPFQHRPLSIRFSGPLLAAPGGYPTRCWGTNGEGLELATAGEARAAVRRLVQKGAGVVKLAFDPRFPLLEPQVASAAADEAHRLGLLVAAHALDTGSVRQALDAGADVLAHTPRDPLPADLLARMKGRWVISTLRAFSVPAERLRALHAAGARAAYGTDLGNENTAPRLENFLGLPAGCPEGGGAALGRGIHLVVEKGDREGEQSLHSLKLDGVGEDRACRFLSPEGACSVHARHGLDALPDLCVDFPA